MKFWKKFKIKFNKNKRFRMWTIITLILGIATLISGFIANVQKENDDELKSNADKIENNKFKNAVLESTKKVESNTDCTRFFEEHKFERFNHHFIKGYIVIRQDGDDSSCRKTFGDKHYTDFSEFKIYKKENEYFLHTKIEFAQNLFGKNGTFQNVRFGEDNRIDMNTLNTPQRIWGWSINLPDGRRVVNALVVIKNTEPYVYAFGLTFKDRTISVR